MKTGIRLNFAVWACVVAAAGAFAAPEAPVGAVRVGFSLGVGEWTALSRNVRPPSFRFVDAAPVTHAQMTSLSVATNGNLITVIWKGHPVCGDGFTVTAELALLPEGGVEYRRFS